MTTLGGLRIYPSSLLVETKIMRVRGGYLNRWLIRAEVTVPSTKLIHDRINNVFYCHPDALEKLTRFAGVLHRAEVLIHEEKAPAFTCHVVTHLTAAPDPAAESLRPLTGKRLAEWKNRKGFKK